MGMRQLDVVGIRIDDNRNQTLVLLREVSGDRVLPIWIGPAEAAAIAYAQQGVVPPRPLTHDLMRDLVTALGRSVSQVRITELRDGIFYAVLDLTGGSSQVEVSARPSDAIALALRTGSPIFGADEVLEAAGIELEEDTDDEEHEVELFRDFLDNVSPADFEGGSTSSESPPDV